MFFLLLNNKKKTINILMSFNNYSKYYIKNNYLYDMGKKECEEINFEKIDEDMLIQLEIQSYIIENNIILDNIISDDVVKGNMRGILNRHCKLDITYEQISYYIHLIIAYLILVENDLNRASNLFIYYFLGYEDLKDTNYLLERSKYFLGYPVSLEKLIELLENSTKYYLSENYISREKNIIQNYFANNR